MSSLSPEEKKRIYEEEKARIEKEATAPRPVAQRKTTAAGIAVKILGGVVLALLILTLIVVIIQPPGSAPTTESTAAPVVTTAISPTCGPITGKSAADLENLRAFCQKGIAKNGVVVGADAMDSILHVKVSREIADSMRADRLSAEQLVRAWMKGWRITTGKTSVSVSIDWQDVEIANGRTTLTSGDQVTMR